MRVSAWVHASALAFVFSRVTDRLRSLMIRFNEWESRAIKVSAYRVLLQGSYLRRLPCLYICLFSKRILCVLRTVGYLSFGRMAQCVVHALTSQKT